MTSWTKIMASEPLFQNTFILKRPRVAIFADIIKIVTILNKTIFPAGTQRLGDVLEGPLKVPTSGTYRGPSGDSQGTNTKTDDLMKKQ